MSARLILGDCLEVLPTLEAGSVDACVCDPPYELGFMGKGWDQSGVANLPMTWRAVLRVLKPGAYLLAFGGTRTHHRMTCAIEDAGFVIEDEIAWVYGSGFPKGQGKLKPAHEPIVVAKRPGRGGLNTEAGRVGTSGGTCRDGKGFMPTVAGWSNMRGHGIAELPAGRWPANLVLDPESARLLDQQSGVSVTPARVTRGGIRQQAFGMRRQDDVACYGDEGGASRFFHVFDAPPMLYVPKASRSERDRGLDGQPLQTMKLPGKATGFNPETGQITDGYTGERRNHHPTVKPIKLLRHLVRLACPPGGTVLDPFMGSGSCGVACRAEGMSYLGIDREQEYVTLSQYRLDHWEVECRDEEETVTERTEPRRVQGVLSLEGWA